MSQLNFDISAALTADMWSHVYVQQANSIFAGVTPRPPSSPTSTMADRGHGHGHGHRHHESVAGLEKDYDGSVCEFCGSIWSQVPEWGDYECRSREDPDRCLSTGRFGPYHGEWD